MGVCSQVCPILAVDDGMAQMTATELTHTLPTPNPNVILSL